MDNLYYSELVDAFTALNSKYKEISIYNNTSVRAIVHLKLLCKQLDTLASVAATCHVHYKLNEDEELSSSFEKLQIEIIEAKDNAAKQIVTRTETVKDIIYQ